MVSVTLWSKTSLCFASYSAVATTSGKIWLPSVTHGLPEAKLIGVPLGSIPGSLESE